MNSSVVPPVQVQLLNFPPKLNIPQHHWTLDVFSASKSGTLMDESLCHVQNLVEGELWCGAGSAP